MQDPLLFGQGKNQSSKKRICADRNESYCRGNKEISRQGPERKVSGICAAWNAELDVPMVQAVGFEYAPRNRRNISADLFAGNPGQYLRSEERRVGKEC